MNPFHDTDPATLHARRSAGDTSFVLLDVREPEEVELACLEGALRMPMGDVPQRMQELDPEQEIIVMCHHGRRSAQVCAYLAQAGFSRVKNLRGGIHAWAVQVDPSVGTY